MQQPCHQSAAGGIPVSALMSQHAISTSNFYLDRSETSSLVISLISFAIAQDQLITDISYFSRSSTVQALLFTY
jgi:hypothetical protein